MTASRIAVPPRPQKYVDYIRSTGQTEPVWVWWSLDEPEDGLLGFHTKVDRDRFDRRKPGPYRRRVASDGKTISQTETWGEMIARLTGELGP